MKWSTKIIFKLHLGYLVIICIDKMLLHRICMCVLHSSASVII